jgi:hypothetical protein
MPTSSPAGDASSPGRRGCPKWDFRPSRSARSRRWRPRRPGGLLPGPSQAGSRDCAVGRRAGEDQGCRRSGGGHRGCGGGDEGAPAAAVIPFPSGTRVWLATGRTDMRRGMNERPGAAGPGGAQARPLRRSCLRLPRETRSSAGTSVGRWPGRLPLRQEARARQVHFLLPLSTMLGMPSRSPREGRRTVAAHDPHG